MRDAIDQVTEGQLRQSLSAEAEQSLRDHALRATSDYFLEYLVLTIGLGPLVDKPADRWAEGFLPEMLARGVRDTVLRNADGSTHPLVKSEEAQLEHHDTRLTKPPRWTPHFFVAGALVGLYFIGITQLSRRLRAATISLGAILTAAGLVIGLLGVALAALWTMTDHAVAYRNQNLLLLSPLALGLPWFGVRIVTRGVAAIGALRQLSALLVASTVLALAVKVLPVEEQDNVTLIAFFLPCWVGLLGGSLLANRATANNPRA